MPCDPVGTRRPDVRDQDEKYATGCDQAIKIFNRVTRIATWNIRSLFKAGKLANVEQEMRRMKIEILGLNEVRWPDAGKLKTNHGMIYFSGGNDANHRYGVAVIVAANINHAVADFVPINDRVMLLKLKTNRGMLNIIQVYAPTLDKEDEEIEQFYADVEEAIQLVKRGEITIIMGDFNAKIKQGAEENIAGTHGLGSRNRRGDRLVQFCLENDLCISNTFFKLPPRRIYTWKSPADQPNNIVRNQIDFILVKKWFRKFVKSVKTYPGADAESGRNPVVMEMEIYRFLKAKALNQSA